MTIAFLVQAHADPEHLARLVARLKPHRVFVHLDAKTELSEDFRRIDATFVAARVPVYWAGFSQIRATAGLIRAALESGETFGKLVLLSGSCYPARPVAALAELFEGDGGRNYIHYVAMADGPHLRAQFERYFIERPLLPERWTRRSRTLALADKALRRLAERLIALRGHPDRLPLPPCHGSQWWALSPEAARHVLDRIDHDPAIARAYRRRFAPDEQVVHSLIADSPFAESSTGQIPYAGRGVWRTANLHLIDPSLSRWYGIDDLAEIRASGKFFVRKVRTADGAALCDALDRDAERAGEAERAA